MQAALRLRPRLLLGKRQLYLLQPGASLGRYAGRGRAYAEFVARRHLVSGCPQLAELHACGPHGRKATQVTVNGERSLLAIGYRFNQVAWSKSGISAREHSRRAGCQGLYINADRALGSYLNSVFRR